LLLSRYRKTEYNNGWFSLGYLFTEAAPLDLACNAW
jgi:hypothetical protein